MSLLSPICKQPSGAIEIDILEILMKESPRRASATENIFPGSFVIYFETAISPNTSKGELPTTTENIKVAFQGLQKIAWSSITKKYFFFAWLLEKVIICYVK